MQNINFAVNQSVINDKLIILNERISSNIMDVTHSDNSIINREDKYAEIIESAQSIINLLQMKDENANKIKEENSIEITDDIFSDCSPTCDQTEEIIDKLDYTYASKKISRDQYHPISNELRKRIIDSLEHGMCSRKEAAITFNVPYSSVHRIFKSFLQHSQIMKRKRMLYKPHKLNEIQKQFIVDELAEDCTLTLKELVDRVQKKYDVKVDSTTIRNYLKNFHFSLKRVQNVPVAATTTNKIVKLKIYSKQFLRLYNSEKCIIYLDEVGFQVSMRRFSGRALPGIRAHKITPYLKTRIKTIMVAMTKNELLHYKILSGNGNRESFLDFLHELSEELLSRQMTNVIIILDNVIFHKCKEIAEYVQSVGHELQFLPPYSPFFNPIENMFHQWKMYVRSKNPNNEAELEEHIETFFMIVTKAECENYCAHVVNNAKLCIEGELVYNI